jgi:hypothetical protein
VCRAKHKITTIVGWKGGPRANSGKGGGGGRERKRKYKDASKYKMMTVNTTIPYTNKHNESGKRQLCSIQAIIHKGEFPWLKSNQ